MKRSEAREIVFKIIFQREFHGEFETMYERLCDENELKGAQREYAVDTIRGILDNLNVIDKIISANLIDWTPERLPKTVIGLLRIGIYEILFNAEIPDVTAIDEAVKIAYKYCDEKDCDFVNGMLHNIYENKKKQV